MDIISLPVEYDKEKIDSRYRLVIIAAQRARELSLGASQKVQAKTKKATTTAIIEAVSNAVEFITGEEAVIAKEKAEKIDYKKLVEARRKPLTDLSELEKDLKIYLHEREATEKALEELFGESERIEEDKEAAEE
jgi:DNA-directed RNA polymerase subunit omega